MRLSTLRVYRAGGHRWAYWRGGVGWVVAGEVDLGEPGEQLPDEIIELMQRPAPESDLLELSLLVAAHEGHGRRSAFTPRVDQRTREAPAARARRTVLAVR